MGGKHQERRVRDGHESAYSENGKIQCKSLLWFGSEPVAQLRASSLSRMSGNSRCFMNGCPVGSFISLVFVLCNMTLIDPKP